MALDLPWSRTPCAPQPYPISQPGIGILDRGRVHLLTDLAPRLHPEGGPLVANASFTAGSPGQQPHVPFSGMQNTEDVAFAL